MRNAGPSVLLAQTFVPGGPGNSMGARALYLGGTLYRTHGINDPRTAGRALSSGYIPMFDEKVIHLFEGGKSWHAHRR